MKNTLQQIITKDLFNSIQGICIKFHGYLPGWSGVVAHMCNYCTQEYKKFKASLAYMVNSSEFVFKNHAWGINNENVLLLPKDCLFLLLVSFIPGVLTSLIMQKNKYKKRKKKTFLLKISIIYVKYAKYLFKKILELSLVRLLSTMSVYKCHVSIF